MSVLGKFVSLISGRDAPLSVTKLPTPDVASNLPAIGDELEARAPALDIRVSIGTNWSTPGNGSNEKLGIEISERLLGYDYVLKPCQKSLNQFSPWWNRGLHEKLWARRHNDAYSWLSPFLPADIARAAPLHTALQHGVGGAKKLPYALRALIREKRKSKEPHRDLLSALYGACVMADLVESLSVEFHTFFADITQFVDLGDLTKMRCDYTRMGYRRVQSLKPTDVKWLVKEFGEPMVHLSYIPLWDSLRRDAVWRYCRAELRRNNSRLKSEEDVEAALPEWLQGRIGFSVNLHNEDRMRAAATLARDRQRDATLETMKGIWDITHRDFVVADVETTGLDSTTCEILELAAILSNSDGVVISQYSALIRISKPVPAFITGLTGISQSDVDREGRPLGEALQGFLAFLRNRPVFFHNAPFDKSFLECATAKSGLEFLNPVHDTLPIARAAWPGMRSHKLETLVKIIDGAPTPNHRALADAKATLAVLMAAREVAGCEAPTTLRTGEQS